MPAPSLIRKTRASVTGSSANASKPASPSAPSSAAPGAMGGGVCARCGVRGFGATRQHARERQEPRRTSDSTYVAFIPLAVVHQVLMLIEEHAVAIKRLGVLHACTLPIHVVRLGRVVPTRPGPNVRAGTSYRARRSAHTRMQTHAQARARAWQLAHRSVTYLDGREPLVVVCAELLGAHTHAPVLGCALENVQAGIGLLAHGLVLARRGPRSAAHSCNAIASMRWHARRTAARWRCGS